MRCQTHTLCVKSVVGGCWALTQGAGVRGGEREARGRGRVCVCVAGSRCTAETSTLYKAIIFQ